MKWKNSLFNYKYFNITSDKIYLDDANITPISCYWSICRVKISKNKFKWTFSCSNWYNYSNDTKSFDISFANTPFIESVIFSWDLKQWTKVLIKWNNFDNSNISISNLFPNNESGKLDIKVSDTEIEWRISMTYDLVKTTTISITNNWLTSSLSFIWSELKWKTIMGAPLINKITSLSNDKLIRHWSKLQITWKWFNGWDIVNIWWITTPLLLENNSKWIWTFYLPNEIEIWDQNLYIKNIDWVQSSNYQLLVLSTNFENNITINSINLPSKTFETNNAYINDKIYSLNITNKINDITITNLGFKFNTTKTKSWSVLDLWSFTLKLNWKIIWNSLIDDNWILNFKENIIINKSNTDHELSLYKDSNYINEWNFIIDFDINSISAFENETFKNFTNFNYKNIFWNNLVIYLKENKKCYDSLIDLSNCNKYVTKNLTNKQNTNNEDLSVINNNNDINESNNDDLNNEENINNDDLVNKKNKKIKKKLDVFYIKLSKNTLKSQVDFLNEFRHVIKNFSKNIKTKEQKAIINFLFTDVSSQYSKVLNEYNLSK
jgi:hypothetical protein